MNRTSDGAIVLDVSWKKFCLDQQSVEKNIELGVRFRLWSENDLNDLNYF
jgi:hypothetical protein